VLTSSSDDAVLIAASRSLVAIAGKEGAKAVTERAASAEPGEKRLLEVLEQKE